MGNGLASLFILFFFFFNGTPPGVWAALPKIKGWGEGRASAEARKENAAALKNIESRKVRMELILPSVRSTIRLISPRGREELDFGPAVWLRFFRMIQFIFIVTLSNFFYPTAFAAVKNAPGKLGAIGPNPSSPRAEKQLSLPVGTPITVLDFDVKTNTFLLSLNDAPAVGPNYAAPEDLHRAIGFSGSFDSFTKQRGQMVGSLYQLARPCPLVSESEMIIRNKKARAGLPADSTR